MSSNLEIRVLGDLQVIRGGVPVELTPSKKTRALLAYLAVLGRPQRRERLCEMFWEVPDDPRGALRWSLSKIRGLLGDEESHSLVADRNTVAIAPGAVVTDYARVRNLTAEGLDSLDTTALVEVADAFRGGFLDDLAMPRCPGFEAWRTAHINDLELIRLNVLRRLVDRLAGQPEVALPYAHQLQRLMPDDPKLPRLVASLADAARRHSVEGPAPAAAREVAPGPIAAPTPVGMPPPLAESPPEPAEIRFCTTRDGVRVAYSVMGSGPPLVRAAHWMSHLQYDLESPVWRHWMRELSVGATLVRYDERGNGMSEWDVEDVGFEAMVADLESIIDAAGLDKVVLLGVSQSCAVSVAYAVRHPERVLGLILYGGYVKGWRARGNPSEIALRQAMGTLMREGWGRDEPVFRQLFTALFIPGASREQMDWFNDLQRRTVTAENAFRLAESFGEIDVADLLPRVSVPTLVIHGRGDRVAPIDSGKAFAAGIPGARFVELDTENHILLDGEPSFDIFVSEVRRFLAEVTRAAEPAPPTDAKRPVSILVADIVSPLDAFATVDPEVAEAALRPLIEATVEAIERHGGAVIDVREGMVTAAFGAARAYEEHTVQACRAARAVRESIERVGKRTAKVRIGIDAGEAVVRPGRSSGRLGASGPVVKAATRLATSLRREAVALTGRARESAGGFIKVIRLPRADSPGLARDENVFELTAENKALSRWYLRASQSLTPLVGRGAEMAALDEHWRRAREGNGGAVGIVAGPGVGKSRLVHEFVGGQAPTGFTLVEAGAQEFDERISLGLVKRVLLSLFGLDSDEDPAALAGAVHRRREQLGLDAAMTTPLLFALDLGVDEPGWTEIQGAERTRRVREAVAALFIREAAAKPLMLLVEDLHWADVESCRVLERLVKEAAEQRILLVATYRPEFQAAWSGVRCVREIPLKPLSDAESHAFVSALLGSDPSVGDLAGLICERTEGVPLFIEEIVGALLQSRRIAGRPGTMKVLQETSRLDIPASVQSVIAARIDKLDPVDRTLLQVASVIGAVVPAALLKRVAGLAAGTDAALERLNAAELLLKGRAGPDPEYVFKHALIQDATYASLPADRRRALHAATLEALEAGHPDRQAEQVERLALHALRAENWEWAVAYLIAAADRAVERSAYAQAAEFLEQAVEAVSRLPETPERIAIAIDIRTRMRISYMVTGDFDKAIGRSREAQDLARRAGDLHRLAFTLLHTSYAYSDGRMDHALAAAEEARAIGVRVGDGRVIAEADMAAAASFMIRGEAKPAVARLMPHREAFLNRWADDRLGFLVTRSVWYLGSLASARALLGQIDEARADSDQALRCADESGRPIDRFAAVYFDSLVQILAGPDDAFIAALAETVVECRDRAPFPFHPWIQATLGHALLVAGRRKEAAAALELAFEVAEQANMPHFMTYASALLAIALARPGDVASRDDLIDALRNARESRDPWIETEVLAALSEVEMSPTLALARLEEAQQSAERSGLLALKARVDRLMDERRGAEIARQVAE